MKNQPKQDVGPVFVLKNENLGNGMTLVAQLIPPFPCPVRSGSIECEFECTAVITKNFFGFQAPYALGTLTYPDGRTAWYDGMPLKKGVQIDAGKYLVVAHFDLARSIVAVLKKLSDLPSCESQ